MSDQIMLLAIGFLLTTVAGGLLGYYFQQRTWNANRKEAEREAAAGVFDEISRLLDRRLYRMRQLNWRLLGSDETALNQSMDAYRTALLEWNDNLNRHLALAFRYFGEQVWNHLDKTIYEEFVRLGRQLEASYAVRMSGTSSTSTQPVSLDQELDALSSRLYVLNRYMIALVQEGAVGLYQESRKAATEVPPWR